MKNKSRGVLLASFLTGKTEEEVLEEVQYIADNFELTNKFIFLFEDREDVNKKILTYNADVPQGKSSYNKRLFTMRVHRKKLTNTLYTINALNKAIAQDNDGQTGKHLKLDWEKYRESIMLSMHGELKVHSIDINKIFKIEPPDSE